jgi:hypothetical protein
VIESELQQSEFADDDSVFEASTSKFNFKSYHVGALAHQLEMIEYNGED